MTNSKALASALANFAAAYRPYLEVIGCAGDINVAVQYAVQDMFNQIKNTTTATAIATIEDEILYIQEATARKEAA